VRWHNLPLEVIAVPTRNVVITEHQQELIESLVESGRFQNASEVLRDGLRLVEQREARDAAKLKALREAVDKGWADVAAGRYIDVADEDLDDYIAGLGKRATKSAAAG
jgi:antitoxin ParD1/3/4